MVFWDCLSLPVQVMLPLLRVAKELKASNPRLLLVRYCSLSPGAGSFTEHSYRPLPREVNKQGEKHLFVTLRGTEEKRALLPTSLTLQIDTMTLYILERTLVGVLDITGAVGV